VTRHVHFFVHEWWRVSRHAGKDSVTNNLLLRVLGSRHTEHSNVVCIRIYKFMKSSEDPQQWPDSYTFHTLVKELVRKGLFNQAVGMVKDAYEHIEDKRKRGLQPQGFWRHTIEYLMGTLLGSQHTRLAERLRKIAADHGFVVGCPIREIDDD
jgi:hypothetical protein